MRKLLLLLIVFVIVVLGITTLYNTINTFSKQPHIKTKAALPLNDSLAIKRLSAALRIPLVNNPIDSVFAKASKQFPEFLRDAFPAFHNDPAVNIMSFGDNSLLYRWKGRDSRLKPILLIAETDVKDPDLKKLPQWTYNPFLGKQAAGYIWGAGVMESKSAAIAILEALEASVNDDRIPQRSIYLALVNNSVGNKKNIHEILSELLYNEGLEFEFVLNTDSYISDGVCMSLNRPVAAVAVSEKTGLTLNLKGYSPELLKKNLENLALKSFSVKTRGKAADQLLETLVPELNFADRWMFSNRFLFAPLIGSILKNDALLSEMFGIDMEVTELEGAEASVNWHLPPDCDIKKFKKIVNDEFEDAQATWSEVPKNRGLSINQGFAYEALQTTIRQSMGDVVVLPAIKTKPGNMAYYKKLSPALFDFRPWTFDAAEIERLRNGIDQRLRLKQYLEGVNFYRVLFINTLF